MRCEDIKGQVIHALEKEYSRIDAALVIVYGRRRVGKTTLISEFIKRKRALYFLVTQESERINRENFSESNQ